MTTPTTALVLPGSIPGLLRRGSPVVCGPRYYGDVWLDRTAGVLDGKGYALATTFQGSTGAFRVTDSTVALDLSEATGRAHAAWWLARECGWAATERIWWWNVGDGRWSIRCERSGYVTFRAPGSPELGKRSPEVPGLAALDPHDPRTLECGTPWVDAEALRLVVRHVAGLSGSEAP